MQLAAGSRGLAVVGLLHPDDHGGSPVPVRLVVSAAVRRAGGGPIDVEITMDGLRASGGSLIWLVTTNKGWAHLRGVATDRTTGAGRPFRADLFAASGAGDDGPDRLALRFYAAGADPNIAGPTHKIHGWLDRGSIRFGP